MTSSHHSPLSQITHYTVFIFLPLQPLNSCSYMEPPKMTMPVKPVPGNAWGVYPALPWPLTCSSLFYRCRLLKEPFSGPSAVLCLSLFTLSSLLLLPSSVLGPLKKLNGGWYLCVLFPSMSGRLAAQLSEGEMEYSQ